MHPPSPAVAPQRRAPPASSSSSVTRVRDALLSLLQHPGITRLAPLPRRPTGSANGEGGRQRRDVVCEKVASPPSRWRSSQGPAEVLLLLLLPPQREVGFGRSLTPLVRRCGCSCVYYLFPTAPTRGPCEKQTPRGLAEEAGERFPSPCHGCCCCCPCSPRDSGTSHSRPARNGCCAGFCSVQWLGRRCPWLPGPRYDHGPQLCTARIFRRGIRHFDWLVKCGCILPVVPEKAQ